MTDRIRSMSDEELAECLGEAMQNAHRLNVRSQTMCAIQKYAGSTG